MKISDLVRQVKFKKYGVSEEQVLDYVTSPDLPKGSAFDLDIFCKQISHKIPVVVCKQRTAIDIILTDMAGKTSDDADAGRLYSEKISS